MNDKFQGFGSGSGLKKTFHIQFQTASKNASCIKMAENGKKSILVLQKYVETCLKYITFNPLIDCEI